MVTIEGLKKQYGAFALDVSLEIPAGRITGLVGKNGAGKSTVIKALLGLIRPDGGKVTVFGKEAASLRAADRLKIGTALSNSGFSAYLKLEEVVRILAKFYPDFNETAFRRACEEMGLPFGKQLQHYSTGMKAKLRVLTALCHDAGLLVMDEPTTGLDVEARGEVLDSIRRYAAEHEDCSMLITSHIASDLEGLCDDLYLIHEGKILLHEDTDVLLSEYGLLRVDAETYARLDPRYLLSRRPEGNGYLCFTDQKRYYAENYPGILIEKGGIDDLILMMTSAEGRTLQ
jgi:ABC-2 type transport system ATP-binding protein